MKVKLMNFSKILIFIILCLILILYNFDIFTSTMLILIYSILNSINIFDNKMKIDYEKLVFQSATGLYLQRDLLFLDKEKYLDLIQSDKRLLLNFIREISNKSQYLSKRIWFNFTHKTIEEKVLSYIKENAQDDKIKFLPSISALAKKFEVTRPALSREISNLCKKKILTKIENTNDTL